MTTGRIGCSFMQGKGCKRFKTVDNQQDLMQRKFSETIRHGLPVDPISFSELPDIYEKLSEDHLVVVCGTRNSSYLQAALTAIEGMGYAKDRCFELNEASDWWRVTFEEADCIVVVNPFGKVFFDKHKASAMSDVFNSMLSATRDEQVQGFKFHDIVIITEKALLYDCKEYFPHDLLEAEITIPESEIIEGTSKPALDDVSIDDTYTDDTAANKELRYIRELNISNPEEANADIGHICTIPPDKLALTDKNNNCLKLIDIRNGRITACIQLSSIPGSLAVLPQDNLAVGLPDDCLIQLFSINPELKKGRSIRVNDACCSITYVNDMLFAFFYTRHIEAYNLKGEILETLTLDPEIHDLCSYCFNVSVCPNKTSFYISDMEKYLLFRINLKGKVIAMYKYNDLFEPEQILATSDGSLLVCNSAKNTVLHMKADLTRPRVILGRSDNVINPKAICYWQEENIIIISCSSKSPDNHDTLKCFQ
ncbi:uncharacterized protein LOC128552689 [Mercenaria mercenaria]|uniref:uncharacterized protein LOC128552689 n=1 Tax=Mercenaria mercenaria TaxID=6596 RepID=UPI00234EA870|nr:uncharacterized protein LOC128552689 [Mercenaria mercenaria]